MHLRWRAMTLLHLPQGEGVQVADHQLLGHPMMVQVILEEDHELGEVEVQVHHVLKQPMIVPLMLEEEDHQVGGGGEEVEAEEEVLQGFLLCLMCRNDHCLGYVIAICCVCMTWT